MDVTTSNTTIEHIGVVLSWAYSAYLHIRTKTNATSIKVLEGKDELLQLKDALVKATKDESDSWKTRFDSEHAEYSSFREDKRKKLEESQALILALTVENTGLKAKTDITPILEQQRSQTEINNSILSSLNKTGEVLELVLSKLSKA